MKLPITSAGGNFAVGSLATTVPAVVIGGLVVAGAPEWAAIGGGGALGLATAIAAPTLTKGHPGLYMAGAIMAPLATVSIAAEILNRH